MVDPLSVTSGIISLLQFANEAITFIQTAKGSAKERALLGAELSGLKFVLESLVEQIKDDEGGTDWGATVDALQRPDGPLTIIQDTLQVLMSKVESQSGLRKIAQGLKWPFEKREVDSMLNIIGQQKSTIELALENDNRYLAQTLVPWWQSRDAKVL